MRPEGKSSQLRTEKEDWKASDDFHAAKSRPAAQKGKPKMKRPLLGGRKKAQKAQKVSVAWPGGVRFIFVRQ